MTFEEYMRALYQDIPVGVCLGLAVLLCIGVAVIMGCYEWRRGCRKIAGLMLAEYVFLIYCSTVVYRTCLETRRYDFTPFWSYKAIEEGRAELLPENIMNVVVFVPVGILFGCAFRCMTWWKAILIGCGISVSIEALQFSFHRGFAETDDVIHNTLGCAIGFGIAKLMMIIYSAIVGHNKCAKYR